MLLKSLENEMFQDEIVKEHKQSSHPYFRSSRLQMFFKIGVLKNFAIFTSALEILSNKVAGLKDCRLRCFPVNIAKFLRTPFL